MPRSSTTRLTFEQAPQSTRTAGLDVAAGPAARQPPRAGARPRRRRQRAADGAAGLHAGDRRSGARRSGSVAAPPADRGDGRDDGVHRAVARAAAVSAELLRRFASTRRRSTSSRGACSRCRCRTSRRGAPAICSAGSKASGRCATSSCRTASPASRPSRRLAATVALMAFYSPWLTLVFLATAPLYALLMIMAAQDAAADLPRPRGLVQQSTTPIRSTRSRASKRSRPWAANRRSAGCCSISSWACRERSSRADFTAMSYEGAIDAVTFLGVGLFLWAGAYEVLERPAVDRRPGRVQFARRALDGADPQSAGALGQPPALRRAAQPAGRRVSA